MNSFQIDITTMTQSDETAKVFVIFDESSAPPLKKERK